MTQLTVRQEQQELAQSWSDEDVRLIRDMAAKGASDSEFKLLMYLAKKYQLDPLAKQIWCVKYGNNPASIYAGRDGFLKIAHDSGMFDGMETVAIRDEGDRLLGARCTVWRKDMRHPFIVEVRLDEYDTKQNLWQTKKETQIKKVSESQALRKAFPISGLYGPEEMPDNELTPSLPTKQEVVNTSTGEIIETTAQPVEASKQDKPKQHKKLSDEEIHNRSRVAKFIWEQTGLETIPKGQVEFGSITLEQFNTALKKITNCPEATTAARKYGINGAWDVVVKERHNGEGLRMGQMLSAALHIMWEKEQELHAEPVAVEATTEQDEWDLFGQPVAVKA